jgi:hypothetical protein
LEPVIVRVKAGPPAKAVAGATLEIVGVSGAVTVRVRELDGALPGFRTVTLAELAVATFAARTRAVSWVALTMGVASGEPFHCTVAPETKPLPVIVRLKAGPPAATELGLRAEMAGVGAAIVNVRLLESTAEGLTTRTVAVPKVATREAGICAVSCVGLTNDVVTGAPFHWTTEPETKPVPVTVSVKPGEPAATELGLTAATTAAEGRETVKLSALEAGTPVSRTVMVALPATESRLAVTCAVS